MHLRKKKGAGGGRGEANAGESVLATPLWGILYADDAGVVLQPPEQLRKVMGLIVVVCAAFGITVSEAKTEILRLRTKGDAGVHRHIQRRGSGQVPNPTNELVYLGGNVSHNSSDLSIEVNGAYAMHGAASGSTPSNCTTDQGFLSSSKSGCSEPRNSRQCCTAVSRGAHARATTTRCAKPTAAS